MDGNGLLKTYALSMEDKMAAAVHLGALGIMGETAPSRFCLFFYRKVNLVFKFSLPKISPQVVRTIYSLYLTSFRSQTYAQTFSSVGAATKWF